MYGPIFESMFTGSMMGAGSDVIAVMAYAIAACDGNGDLEINPKLLALQIGCSQDEIRDAIDVLTAPDEESRSKLLDGVRLQKTGEYDYRLVNYDFYQELAKAKNTAERKKKREQKRRDDKKAQDAIDSEIVSNRVESCSSVSHRRQKTEMENRDGIMEPNGSLSSAGRNDEKKTDPRMPILSEILDRWNGESLLAGCKPKTILKPTTQAAKKRRASALARIKEHPNVENWFTVIDRIAARPHCCGDNDRGWVADIEYLFRVETYDDHMTGKHSRAIPRASAAKTGGYTGMEFDPDETFDDD